MKSSMELRLLIHHHHTAFIDHEDVIWLTSVMGRWVDALADCLEQVGLLFYQSAEHSPRLDTPVTKPNVKLYSLGPRKTVRERMFRKNDLRRVCFEASKGAGGLLIRGMTPHQHAIWRYTPTVHKAFLLVGSLKREQDRLRRSLDEILAEILYFVRLSQVRQIANNMTLMLANSPSLVDEIDARFGKRAWFVPTNSIRKNEFAPLVVRPLADPRKLLYCGRLDIRKGLRELLEALAVLNQQGPRFHLDILGAAGEPAFSELRDLADGLGIGDQISWHGLVSYGPGLFEYYRQADALILPSYSEGFPHVIWEAMANCCPVIATSVGGIPALIQHEEHALLVPPKEVESIVMAVRRLFADEATRRRLIEQAYPRAADFSVEACAQKLAATLSDQWS
jgi:glycosyltransferase involved in cell wall biosynthesis